MHRILPSFSLLIVRIALAVFCSAIGTSHAQQQTLTLNYSNSAVFDTQIAGPEDDPSTTTRDEPNHNFDSFFGANIRAGDLTRQIALLQAQGFVSNLKIPPGSTIHSASLRLFFNSVFTNGDTALRRVRIHRMLQPWTTDSEDPTTWNNPNNAFGTNGIRADGTHAQTTPTAELVLDNANGNTANRFYSVDVTSDVQAWVNGTAPNFGWAFLTDNQAATASFRTTNHALFNTAETKPGTAPAGTPADPILPLNKTYAALTNAEWRQVQSPTLSITYTPAPTTTDTKLTDAEFFAKLDYASFPALAAVNAARQAGNFALARTEFATYLRARTQPVVPDPSDWTTNISSTPPAPGTTRLASSTTAEKALSLQFTADATTYTFASGLPIDWEFTPGASNFTQYMNRFSYGEDMAKAFQQTGNPIYVAGQPSPRLYGFAEILRDWIVNNQVPLAKLNGSGIQAWTTMQAGLRAGHFWPRAWQRLVRSTALDDQTLVLWAKSYWEHGNYLHTFRASGNSLAMETNGLFMTATLFPEFTDSPTWRQAATTRLIEETGSNGQIYSDGAQVELTPLYHFTSLRHFANVLRTAQANNQTVSPQVLTALESMFDYAMRLAEPGLQFPDFNDSDPVGAGTLTGWMQFGFQLFPTRTDFQYFATSRSSGTAPEQTSMLIPFAGQAIMRSDWTAQARYLAFEGGPLGTSHYHDDKLGFVLNAFGERLIIDSGRYAYDGSDYELYGRSANAHSLVHVGNFRQSRRLSAGVYRATQPYNIEWETDASYDYVTADFGSRSGEVFRDGLSSSSPTLEGSKHRRHIVFVKPDYWILIDDITQPDAVARPLVQQFHLANHATSIDPATQRVTLQRAGGPSLTLTPLVESGSGLTASITQGQTSPEILGWQMTGGTGTRTAIPVARFTRSAAGRQQFVTVLAPANTGVSPLTPTLTRFDTGNPNLYGVRVQWNNGRPSTDVIVNLDETQPIQWNGSIYTTRAIVLPSSGQPHTWGQTVVLALDNATATEGQASRPTFTVTRAGGDTSVPLTVNYTLSGTAVSGMDFEALNGSVVIPAGAATAKIFVRLTDDLVAEPQKQLILTLSENAAYKIPSGRGAQTLTLFDDDHLVASHLHLTVPAGGSTSGSLTFNRPAGLSSAATYSLVSATSQYSFVRSTAPGGPVYNWTDIRASGTPITQWQRKLGPNQLGVETWPNVAIDAHASTIIDFADGFTFPFYGETATRLRVHTAGFLTLGTGSTEPTILNRDNYPQDILSQDPAYFFSSFTSRAAIYAYNAFFGLPNNTTAGIYYQQFPDRFVIQWHNVRQSDATWMRGTFQAHLFPDGTIEFHYASVPSTYTFGTVAITNRAVDQGLYTNWRNNPVIYSNTAIRILPPLPWLSLGQNSLTLSPGASNSLTVNFNAGSLPPGTYTNTITVHGDGLPPGGVQVPVSITVSPTASPSGLEVTRVGDTVQLTWTDNASNETGYRIERRVGETGDWTLLTTVAANTTQFTDNTALLDKAYYYRIIATNGTADSGPTESLGLFLAAQQDPLTVFLQVLAPATEGGADGSLRFNLNRTHDQDLTVHYTVGGTATSGSDYSALPGTIIIPAGQSSATLAIPAINDGILETTNPETLIVTLTSRPDYELGNPSAATVNIHDAASFTATSPVLSNTGLTASTGDFSWTFPPTNATQWRLQRTGNYANHPDLVVYDGFNYTGTTFAGQGGGTGWSANWVSTGGTSTAVAPIISTDSSLANSAYAGTNLPSALGTAGHGALASTGNRASRLLASPIDTSAGGAARSVFFSFLMRTPLDPTGGDFLVGFGNSGDSTHAVIAGIGLRNNAGTWNGRGLIAGSDGSLTNIAQTHDAVPASFTKNTTYFVIGRLDIDPAGNDVIYAWFFTNTIPSSQPTTSLAARTTGRNIAVSSLDRIIMSTSATNTTPSYHVDELRVGSSWVSVTQPAAATWGNDAILPIGQSTTTTTGLLPTQNYSFRLRAEGGGNVSAWSNAVNISTPSASGATVIAEATQPSATETGTPGTFRITRTGDTASALTVNYTLTGTATNGADYTLLPLSQTIPAGQSTATITVSPLADSVIEDNETVVLTLGTGDYTIASPPSAVVTIAEAQAFDAVAPANFSLVVLSATSVRLDWTDNFANEIKFRIFRSTDQVTWTGVDASANATSYTFTGLDSGQTVFFRMRAEKESAPQFSSLTATLSTTPTALNAWKQTHFSTTANSGNSANASDPDGDGVANILEYALGGTPTSAASHPQPTVGLSGQRLTLSFTPQVVSGLTYRIEASSDLTDWTNQTDLTGLTPGVLHTHTDSLDMGSGNPRRFLRLRVLAQ